MTQQHDVVPVAADEQAFDEFAKAQSKRCSVPATNAGVRVDGDKATLDPAKVGAKCTPEVIQEAVLSSSLSRAGTVVTVQVTPIAPERTDSQVRGELQEAQAIIDRTLTLRLPDGTTKPIEKSAIASWIVFPEDEKTRGSFN